MIGRGRISAGTHPPPDGHTAGSETRTAAWRPHEPARRLALALAPAVALVAVLVATGVVAVGPALAIVAAVAGGAIWLARTFRERPADSDADADAVPGAEQPPPAESFDLLDPLPDPVLVLDSDRQLLAANRSARDLFGIGATGQHLARSIRHPAVLAAVETVVSGAPALSEEIVLPVPVPRTFTLHAARLHAADGARVLIALHDETRARRAEQSRVDFVSNVSHELRSPLSALIGFIETLRGPARGDTAAQERFLEIMRREALRMSGLIENLLSLSRVEINEHVRPSGRVDIAWVLEDVSEALAGRAAERDMTLQVDVPADLPHVVGDGDQLTQVFHNLIENSIKYGRAGTPVRISGRTVARMPGGPGGGIAVTVSDRSDGIPAEALPRITERFYRVDEGRSRKGGGTGLGLAIVKHIVNRHRGHLKIESRLGEGSDMTVYLPTASGDDEPAPLPAS